MGFLAPILGSLVSGGLGFLGQQNANNQSVNAQQNAQNQAQTFQQNQLGQAKNYQQQALQQALQNLAQYQQQNPAPISQLGGIQMPGAGGGQNIGQPQQSFGGGVAQMQPPGGMQRPQMPQQNLQGAMQGPPPGAMQQPQQPPAQQFQRLQQLYPLMQQMLAGNRSQSMPQARSQGGVT